MSWSRTGRLLFMGSMESGIYFFWLAGVFASMDRWKMNTRIHISLFSLIHQSHCILTTHQIIIAYIHTFTHRSHRRNQLMNIARMHAFLTSKYVSPPYAPPPPSHVHICKNMFLVHVQTQCLTRRLSLVAKEKPYAFAKWVSSMQ